MSESELLKFTTSPEQAGLRLDKALSFFEMIGSRSRAALLIEKGLVKVAGRPERASYLLQVGDLVEVFVPLRETKTLRPLNLQLDLLYEDDDLIVLDKPAGLVIHPAAGHAQDTLVNALIAHTPNLSMKFGEQRPGIVHRLDKETSGVLVVAKNDFTHEHLTRQFRERTIHRIYQAVVYGSFQRTPMRIQSYLSRHPVERKKFSSLRGNDKKIQREPEPSPSHGKWAVTHAKALSFSKGLSLLEVRLETGRTHQIRVHLSESGYPLVGDSLYGAEARRKSLASPSLRVEISTLQRFLLHARELGFTHPRSAERMHFVRDWPGPIAVMLKDWGLLP